MAIVSGIAICASERSGDSNTRSFEAVISPGEPTLVDDSEGRLALFTFNYGPERVRLLYADTGAAAMELAPLAGDVLFGADLGPIAAALD